MTSQFEHLGTFRVESSEDRESDPDGSYAELIRASGSKQRPPRFSAPSHSFKCSETEIGLCLRERKNLRRATGKPFNLKIDISDHELMIRFTISLFSK